MSAEDWELITCRACEGAGTLLYGDDVGPGDHRETCGYCKGTGKVSRRKVARAPDETSVGTAMTAEYERARVRALAEKGETLDREGYTLSMIKGVPTYTFKSSVEAHRAMRTGEALAGLAQSNACLHGNPPYFDEWREYFKHSTQHRVSFGVYSGTLPNTSVEHLVSLDSMTIHLPLALLTGAARYILEESNGDLRKLYGRRKR